MTAVGIDLGTTNSCVAVWRAGKVEVLPGPDGHAVTPSVVTSLPNGEWRAGSTAVKVAESYPDHTYRAVKRLVGRQFDDPVIALTQGVSAFAIGPADNGEAWIVGREKLHPPAEIQAHILRRLKAAAELALGKTVTQAVITVPAYFNDAQRRATIDAGDIAGLKVLRIINEPTAAALALELDRAEGPQRLAIYDLGGGTFDLSILETAEDGELEVKVSNGDTFLGGEDFDRALVDMLADEFLDQHGVDLRKDVISRARLKLAAEDAKQELSFTETAEISLTRITLVGEERTPATLHRVVTRSQLEQATADLIAKTVAICAEAMAEAQMTPADLTRVVLVGGQTRSPAVQQAVKEFFGGVTMLAPDPDQIVARGAAVMAAALTGQLGLELEDVTPFSIGVEAADGTMIEIIAANSKIPARRVVPFSTLTDDQDAVSVRLRQGNSESPGDNLPLTLFHLEGVRAGKESKRPVVDVTVDLDADGVVTVQARDRGSGRVHADTVDTMGLSPRAIEQMRRLGAKVSKQQTKEESHGLGP
jgi:molecular chaperone DnaK